MFEQKKPKFHIKQNTNFKIILHSSKITKTLVYAVSGVWPTRGAGAPRQWPKPNPGIFIFYLLYLMLSAGKGTGE